MRWLKLSLKLLTGLFVAVAVVVVVCAAFALSAPGKRLVVAFIEKTASETLEGGHLTIGGLRGNYLTRLTLSDIVFESSDGRTRVRVANIVSSHRLVRLVPLRLNFSKIQIEQPRGRVDLASFDSREKKRDDAKDKPSGELPVALEVLRLVEGELTLSNRGHPLLGGSFDGTLEWPSDLLQLPVGELAIDGRARGLPASLRLKLAPDNHQNPQTLSAIAKGPAKNQRMIERRLIEATASLGRSRLGLAADAYVNLHDWKTTTGKFVLREFHYDADEAKRIWNGAPQQVIDGRAFATVKSGAAVAGFEAHVEHSGKAIAEVELKYPEAPAPLETVSMRVRRLRVDGECPLLALARPTTLEFKAGVMAPFGELAARGCAGAIAYSRGIKGLRLELAKLEPAKFMKAFSIPLTRPDLGTVDASISLPQGPRVPLGRAKAKWELPKVLGVVDRASIEATAQLRAGRADADLNVKVGTSSIEGHVAATSLFKNGTWEFDRERARGRAQISSSDFELKRLGSIIMRPIPVSGKLTARVEASGSLQKTKLNYSAKLADTGLDRDVKAGVARLLDFELEGSYDSKELRARLGAQHSENRGKPLPVELDAEVELPQRKLLAPNADEAVRRAPVRWRARVAHFELSRLLAARANLISDSKFWLDAQGKGSGSLDDPQLNATAEVATSSGKLANVEAHFKNHTLDAKLAAHDGRIDEVVPYISNQLQAFDAFLDADFTIHGNLERLSYSGAIGLRADTLRLPGLNTRYRQFKARLVGDDQLVRLEELKLNSQSGTLDAHGTVELARGKEAEALKVSAVLKDFELLANEDMRIESSGKLTLSANRSDSSFTGNFEVEGGKFTLPDEKPNPNAETLKPLADVVIEEKKDKDKAPGLFDRLHGRIAVSVPGRFWVKSSELNVELAADLEVGLDEDTEPVITGTVQARRGFAEFFGRHFDIRRANVEFLGEPDNPHITAEAIYQASPRNIVVEINGGIKKLEPRLSSDPVGYSEEEAMGVLLTGSPDYQSQGGGTSASGALTGLLVGQLKTRLGPKLPFDTITADVASDSQASSTADPNSQTRIEVGKYLTDRLFIKLGRVFAASEQEPVNRLTLDYRLSEKWSLQTSQSDVGRSDVEVQWTLNY